MTIKEEIQIEEYKRAFAEAYKQGFIDAISVCKTEPQRDYTPDCPFCVRYGTDECLRDKCRHYQTYKTEPQTDCSWK